MATREQVGCLVPQEQVGSGVGARAGTGSRRLRPAVTAALLALTVVTVAGALLLPGQAASVDDRDYAELPVSFEVNQGQSDEAVRYVAHAGGYTAFLTDREAVVVPPGGTRQSAVRMRFVGGSPSPAVSGLDRHEGVANYLRGADPADWVTGVPTFAAVRYDDVYPGIDAVFRDDGAGHIAYDVHVAPGADPAVIALGFDGADDVRVDAAGDLVLVTAAGVLRHSAPVVYQEAGGARHAVDGGFHVRDGGEVGFELGEYDPTLPLVIDPVLSYSTYLSGVAADTGNAIAVDDSGAAYVTGVTSSNNFPVTAGAPQGAVGGGSDVFLTKLTPDGSALVYSTYVGGGADDVGNGIALDAGGAAYLTGTTRSADFPTVDPIQADHPSGCPTEDDPARRCVTAFVTKVTADGQSLEYSTYLGGSAGGDVARDIAVDDTGAAYVTGETRSPDFPTAGALDAGDAPGPCPTEDLPEQRCLTAFVTKVAPGGGSLAYSAYLGGSADGNVARSIAVDDNGAAYVTGETRSPDHPTTGAALQAEHPSACPTDASPDRRCLTAFVMKIAADGESLDYSTYLGGSETDYLGDLSDQGFGIAVDGAGAAYVLGHTTADDFPTTASAFQRARAGEHDWFVAKLAPSGGSLAYATYLGSPSQDVAWDIDVDPAGAAYAIGMANTGGFPTELPLDHYSGNEEIITAKLAPDGSALEYATYLGSSTSDRGLAIAVHDASGAAFLTGTASGFSPHDDFPTTEGAFQTERAGTAFGGEAFVARIDPVDDDLPLVTAVNPPSGPAAGATIVTVTGRGFTEDSAVSFGDEPAADVVFESATRLRALTPEGELGTVHVTVTTDEGTSPANPSSTFEYAEGVWRSTGDMVEARNAHSATLLADGRVLVAGGRASRIGPALDSAEVYDPETNTWSATASMGTARFNHTATRLPDGRVLVAGGFTVGFADNAQPFPGTAEIYDPATGQWSPAGEMVVRRAAHNAVLLEDGRVLLIGGRTCAEPPPAVCGHTVRTDTAELYDPATGEFTATGSMEFERHSFAATLLDDGRVLVAGGFGAEVLIEPTVEIYDPATGEWSRTGDLAAGRVRGVARQLEDGSVLHVGGALSYQFTERWDPATGEWSLLQPMPTGRHNFYGALLPDGDLLAAGGGLGGVQAEIFDTQTLTWRSAGVLNTALGSSHLLARTHDAIVLDDGSVLVIGNSDFPAAERYFRNPEPEQLRDLVGCPGDVPPAPFIDRASIPEAHRGNVDCAAERGIVQGFTDNTYGPTLDVRRDQMASFIARTLDAADVELPAASGDRFDDVGEGSVHDDAIHRLAAAEIVLGGPGDLPASSYGPGQDVRRDQMASFLVRAAEFATEQTLANQTQAFDDVPPSNTHFANVNGAFEAGLAQGYATGLYGPADSVRRDQMASFVVRLLVALADVSLTQE